MKGDRMKEILIAKGFTPIGNRIVQNGEIYVGEREAWLGEPLARKCLEVVYFIVSDLPTHGTPATYDPGEGAIPSREERLHEAYRHAEALLNG